MFMISLKEPSGFGTNNQFDWCKAHKTKLHQKKQAFKFLLAHRPGLLKL